MNPYSALQQVANQQSTTNESSSNPYADLKKVATQQTKTPDDVSLVSHDLGDQSYNDYCQEFVEKATGQTEKSPSAIAAWNKYIQNRQAIPSTRGMEAGDVIYFSANPGNKNFGHTGIYAGNGSFISATDNGVKNESITKWQKQTGQKVLGYVKNPNSLPQIGGQNGE